VVETTQWPVYGIWPLVGSLRVYEGSMKADRSFLKGFGIFVARVFSLFFSFFFFWRITVIFNRNRFKDGWNRVGIGQKERDCGVLCAIVTDDTGKLVTISQKARLFLV
jgi:hypothetical protein